METESKNFRVLRAIDIGAFLALLLFVAFFIKTIIAVVDAFQSEAYTNAVAGDRKSVV